MENQSPKNVRQIGNVSDIPKIYIEDYVDTFLNQLCDASEENPTGAFLIGHTVQQEEQECIFISGAVQMLEILVEKSEIVIPEETWKSAREECDVYFSGGEIIGWFFAQQGHPLALNSGIVKIHEQNFGRSGTVFVIKDPVEKEEIYFAYKYKELMQMSGHYIYYEKNPLMQNYMIVKRKQNGVTPSEVVADQAAQDFRSIVREKFELKEQRRTSRLMYAGSVLLVLIVLVIGVTTMNNYDKMRQVQSSLAAMQTTSQGEEPDKDTEEAIEANAPIREITEGQAAPEESADTGTETGEEQTEISTMQEMENDVYVVAEGDTLAKISKRIYGDIGHVDAICRMNGLSDGNLIYIGQKLLLP